MGLKEDKSLRIWKSIVKHSPLYNTWTCSCELTGTVVDHTSLYMANSVKILTSTGKGLIRLHPYLTG